MVGLSGLLLTGADCRYANVMAQQTSGQHRLASELTALSSEAEKAKALTPGSEFRECARGCPVMVVIAAGRFIMGSPDHELDRRASEGPQHEVTIAGPFAVSKFDVTFEEWDACVATSACSRAMDAWGRGEMPVINVSWDDARQYVDWLSRSTGKQYRLLTEAEWEYAARAGSTTRYSWGDEVGTDYASCNGCSDKLRLQTMHWDRSSPTGSASTTCTEMHGNGSKTPGTVTTRRRLQTDRHGSRATEIIGPYAEVPGTTRPN